MSVSFSEAEEKKELGNKAFAAKDFDEAIKQYTAAIALDSKNCVYYSNRSASHGGKKDWKNSAKDAKECIKVNPTFIKGYYRLANAQSQLNDFEAALATIKQGLAIDADNAQLLKQLRQIKGTIRAQASKKAESLAKSAAEQHAGNHIGMNFDSSISAEVADLQQQMITTSKEFRQVKANISHAQKEKQSNEITKRELEKLPADSNAKLYQGVGKMFMLTKQNDIMLDLDRNIHKADEEEENLGGRLSYLERRLKSQQQNIQELTSQ